MIASLGLLIGVIFSQATSADTLALPLYGQELGCLAMNIYQEARGETNKGKVAVAAVTMNRVHNKHYPNTICEVVWQYKQFSWTELGTKYHVINNPRAWQSAVKIAEMTMNGDKKTGVGNATHYHAASISPSWSDDERIITQIGKHIFYAL